MKIRQGFVSNSSSSSFIVIASSEDYEEVLKSLDPYQQALMSKLFEKDYLAGTPFWFLFGEFGTEVPENLTEFESLEGESHVMGDRWGLFNMRFKAFKQAMKKFQNRKGIIFREEY